MKLPFNTISLIIITLTVFSSCGNTENNKSKFHGIYQTSENGFEISFYNDNSKSLKIDTVPIITDLEMKTIEKHYQYQTNKPILNIQLSESGKKKFEKATIENFDKPLAIIFYDKLLAAPTVVSTIPNGKIDVHGIEVELIDEIVKGFKK